MTGRGMWAAAATFAIAAILLLPYCDLLFDCGCGWPWTGLTAHCNIHSHRSPVHCPWCEHPASAALSFALAAAGGAAVAWRGDARGRLGPGGTGGVRSTTGRRGSRPRTARMDLLVRTLAGVGAYLLLAFVAGWITALVTGYPRFLLH